MTDLPTPSTEELERRAIASFLGLALGDALGATTEFMLPSEIARTYGTHDRIIGGGWLHLKPGHVTDDTEMSLAMARAVVATGGWYLPAVADAFVEWMRGKPVDIGSSCRKGLRNYMLKGEISTPPNEWDAGNGALMRMIAVPLFTLGDPATMATCLVEQAHITHNHPLSDAACACVGAMVQAALCGADRFELHRIARELIAKHPNFAFNDYRGEAGGYVVETIRTVFHFFFTTATFEECLVGIVNQGGDADTTGAIGGMLAGAFYGPDALPSKWLKKLHSPVKDEIMLIAPSLIQLSPQYRSCQDS